MGNPLLGMGELVEGAMMPNRSVWLSTAMVLAPDCNAVHSSRALVIVSQGMVHRRR
ncbi:hypothetical protein OIU78_023235, partial [Salix suchowensis]